MKFCKMALLLIGVLVTFSLIGCTKSKKTEEVKTVVKEDEGYKADYTVTEKLPKNINWITNDSDPIFASPDAQKGGTFRTYIQSFPLTLRNVGPDSNGSFRHYINGNQMDLLTFHPNTSKPLPSIATHWAFKGDNKTVYYKLNPKARWSDGKPVTADDFLFTLEFMRSKHIVAPWYNNHYTEYFDRIIKYDDHTIAVVSKKKLSELELLLECGLTPYPRHYYKQLTKDFVKKYNWAIQPNTGPYQISKIKKGKLIEFKRKKDWWAKDLKYFKYRYNVDKIRFKVIRDSNVAYEHFLKNELEITYLTIPKYWHERAKGGIYDKGFVHKLWFYTDQPQPDYGMWLNQDKEIFKDVNVRKAFGHAMNIKKVLKTVLRGDYMRLHNGNTGTGIFENTDIKARPYDLKSVDKYLKLAGWDKRGPDGVRMKGDKRLSATVIYGYPHHQDRLVVLKQEALKAGIELNLKLMDGASSFKAFREKQHDIAWMAWSAGKIPKFWQSYHSDNAHKPQTNNISNTDNPELDKMIKIYRNTFKTEKKAALAREIQKKIYDHATYIPTFKVPYFRVAYWRYWKFPKIKATKMSTTCFDLVDDGFLGSVGGLFWFDKKEKEKTLMAMKNGKKFKPVEMIDTTFKK